ncbi:hypothetical protein POM88_006781 [Heracleum sosnowskyi]|uniref:Uncharacterized protein n=1 Tax=Heracleum sosnowskyi TaxID=360622 RepID=A0AAD8N6U2_9APIA|nr:hypothetical protein POM88_006781 [Heracleum sosnowskyi]
MDTTGKNSPTSEALCTSVCWVIQCLGHNDQKVLASQTPDRRSSGGHIYLCTANLNSNARKGKVRVKEMMARLKEMPARLMGISSEEATPASTLLSASAYSVQEWSVHDHFIRVKPNTPVVVGKAASGGQPKGFDILMGNIKAGHFANVTPKTSVHFALGRKL